MEHLAVFETDKGHFAVRPIEWAGIWNADGKIQECGLRHTAIFETKEDAEWYANMKNSDEQRLLLRLPCKVGDTVWDNDFGKPCAYTITGFSFGTGEDYIDEPVNEKEVVYYYSNSSGSIIGSFAVSEIGKTVFLTQAEAEQKLKETEDE